MFLVFTFFQPFYFSCLNHLNSYASLKWNQAIVLIGSYKFWNFKYVEIIAEFLCLIYFFDKISCKKRNPSYISFQHQSIYFGTLKFLGLVRKGKGQIGQSLRTWCCQFLIKSFKGMFGSHIFRYFCLKIYRYFIFRYLVTLYH